MALQTPFSFYHPPGPYSNFVDEFSEFAADVATYSDNVLLMGDSNIHVNNPCDSLAKAFLSIRDTFGFKQHVQLPTHTGGNTLDLVLTRGFEIIDSCVSPYTSALSDHCLLTFQVVVSCPRDDRQATYSCRRITPDTTTAMADKLPLLRAPLADLRGLVDSLTGVLLYPQPLTLLLLL